MQVVGLPVGVFGSFDRSGGGTVCCDRKEHVEWRSCRTLDLLRSAGTRVTNRSDVIRTVTSSFVFTGDAGAQLDGAHDERP